LLPEGERVAELGDSLRRMDRGRGLASEGASALVNWGFRSGRYDKIFASTMAVNHASRHVIEKIGLIDARTVSVDWPHPIPGSEDGEVQYELLHSGWNGVHRLPQGEKAEEMRTQTIDAM
jgi:RimJ/RimL family protein N-acetyltransferase